MRKRSRRRLMSDMNVVPYIDVMLVLLIIFMVTAPLMHMGVDIKLPQASAKSLQDVEEPVVVSLTRDGTIHLTLGTAKPEVVDTETLVRKIRAFHDQNPKVSVLFGGDEAVDYGKVMQTMVLLQQAGVPDVGLMTEPPEQPAAGG